MLKSGTHRRESEMQHLANALNAEEWRFCWGLPKERVLVFKGMSKSILIYFFKKDFWVSVLGYRPS